MIAAQWIALATCVVCHGVMLSYRYGDNWFWKVRVPKWCWACAIAVLFYGRLV